MNIKKRFLITVGTTLGIGVVALSIMSVSSEAREDSAVQAIVGDAERGAYVIRVAGCIACHTNTLNGGETLAGGRGLKTKYGVFRTPNITPDINTGIGGWSLDTFSTALRQGLAPDGSHYYPAFPYTSYANMTDQDVADLKSYLDSVKPVTNAVADHDLKFPFNIRQAMQVWKALFFNGQTFESDPTKSEQWNRGAYIVNGPGHCVECHTPRNLLGALDDSEALIGTKDGPEGDKVPNISRDLEHGIGQWSPMDVTFLLQMGLTPSGDSVGGAMGEVVRDGMSFLTQEDIAAISTYLLDTP